MASERNPELAAILRSLGQPQYADNDTYASATAEHVEVKQPRLAQPLPHQTSEGLQPQPTDLDRPSAPIIDPSTITVWPAAQKYVIDKIYHDPRVASKVKKLISNQHQQERQWWAERKALVTKHEGRAEKTRAAEVLLRSMGGITTSTMSVTPDEEISELRACDQKIYALLKKSAAEIDRELRAMRVPFFAIKHELVSSAEIRNGGLKPGMVSREELMTLQRRILQLLEELFKD